MNQAAGRVMPWTGWTDWLRHRGGNVGERNELRPCSWKTSPLCSVASSLCKSLYDALPAFPGTGSPPLQPSSWGGGLDTDVGP